MKKIKNSQPQTKFTGSYKKKECSNNDDDSGDNNDDNSNNSNHNIEKSINDNIYLYSCS